MEPTEEDQDLSVTNKKKRKYSLFSAVYSKYFLLLESWLGANSNVSKAVKLRGYSF